MANIQETRASFNNYLKSRSKDYMQYGRYMAKDMSMSDMKLRFFSYLGDSAVMFFFILIWDLLFLLTAASYFPYGIFYILFMAIDVLLMASLLLGNTYLIYAFRGQTFGKIAMNLKVVDQENKELDGRTLLYREVVGIELPILVLMIPFTILGFTPFLGYLIFSIVNGIFVLVDKQHRSIIDAVLKTKVVVLSENAQKATFTPVVEKEKEVVTQAAENRYDLHVYSSFSHDGQIEVEDLFKQAKEAGVEALSICDHNSCKANSIAKKIAPLYHITYIPGINIDADYKGSHVRILGYFIEGNEDRFMQIEYENLAKEKAVSMRRIQLFEEFSGFEVNSEKLLAGNRFQIVSKEMIARQILSNPDYRKTKLLQPYLTGTKKEKPISHFCEDFFGKKGPAYVPVAHPKAEDMIALIKASHGVPVLAHPMYSLGNDEEKLVDLLSEGIEGVEIFTPYHRAADMKKMILLAKKMKLEITAGSEYHGPEKAKFILGKTYCPKDVEEVIKRFIDKHYKMI